MSLELYNQKRDFKKTKEPKGRKTAGAKEDLIFVVQKHAASHLHYDFRLELDGVLKSWAVPKGPCLDPKVKRLAMQVEDHPYEYANFEGIIPKGEYGAGTVIVWDQGIWLPDGEPHQAFNNGNLTLTLKGKKLKGKWKLVQNKKQPKQWLLFKINDKDARPIEEYDITLKKPKSVISGKTIDQVAKNYERIWTRTGEKKLPPKKLLDFKINLPKSTMPTVISPELATLVDAPPTGDVWLHEIKFDGYRLILIKRKNKTKAFTRNGNDWTNKFTAIVKAVDALPIANLILDGEVVILDRDQKSDFQLLQNSLKENKQNDLLFYVFDLLYYDCYSLFKLPLLERKNLLHRVLNTKPNKALRFSDHVIGSGRAVFEKSCEYALEGIVSKKTDSLYVQKRSKEWLKIKCIKRQEFIIAGYTPPSGSRKYFGSLLLGTYNKKTELIYNGNVGTGFTETSLERISKLLKKNETSTMPFAERPAKSSQATWVKPVLVAEVEFTEWTKDNHVRHPSFKGIRSDKPAKDVIKETELAVKKIDKPSERSSTMRKKAGRKELTNLDKVLYPESDVTKGDIAEYYEYIHSWMLPYVEKRPLTLVRCPNSYKTCFYQKHLAEQLPSGLYGIPIVEKKQGEEEYLYIKNVKGLLALTQLGVLEIHPWGSSIKKVENPDVLIFDLDPAEGVKWSEIVDTAFLLKDYLHQLKLQSFVKSTGGKGLHVVAPIKPMHDWQAIKDFSHGLVNFAVQQNPKRYVSKMNKTARQGKIFIDYLRNQRGATAIAPYSTRARAGATIAVPLAWDELTKDIRDATFNIKNIYKRMDGLKEDPWREYCKLKQSLQLN